MKPVSRRSVIAGSAAAVTAIPAVGLCKEATDHASAELLSLIDKHRVAAKAFSDALDRLSAVETIKAKTGLTPRGLARAKRDEDRFGDAELDAWDALCAYCCQSLAEAKIKAEHMLTSYLTRECWDDDARVFLQSFV